MTALIQKAQYVRVAISNDSRVIEKSGEKFPLDLDYKPSPLPYLGRLGPPPLSSVFYFLSFESFYLLIKNTNKQL